MAINSRAKGARGERLFRDELREAGFSARRGQQFAGGTDSPDVICEQLEFLHFEVKCVQNLNVDRVMKEQASRDAGQKIPIISHKKNNSQWLVTLKLTDFLTMLRHSDLEELMKQYRARTAKS